MILPGFRLLGYYEDEKDVEPRDVPHGKRKGRPEKEPSSQASLESIVSVVGCGLHVRVDARMKKKRGCEDAREEENRVDVKMTGMKEKKMIQD